MNVTKKQNFFLGCVENIAGKRENGGYQQFLLFPQCFKKASCSGLLKVRTVWLRVNASPVDKLLDLSKLKAFADDKLNMGQNMMSVFFNTGKYHGKGENAGYQHFLLFP